MELETLNRLFLELSQFCTATTKRESELQSRVRELEDQLRWRKWAEEEPKESGQYLVLDCRGLAEVNYLMIGEDASEGEWVPFPDQLRYWRPIGELPGGE